MACPLCQQRKARRACPALGQTICPVCCGTKRLTEIDCPADCAWLATAREHPAAAVRRQQEHDVAMLLPSVRTLSSERHHQLFFLFHTAIARQKPEGFARLIDQDVAEAAAAAASTFETAARGLIYDHQPQSPIAQQLATELKQLVEGMRQQGAKVFDGEAALVLRAIEQGARTTGANGEGDTAYLSLMGRLLQVNRTLTAATGGSGAPEPEKPASPLILP